jgi:hypothetical protein
MIAISIFWALVLALFRMSPDWPQEQQVANKGDNRMKPKREVSRRVRLGREWGFSRWFAILSPLIGVLLGVLGLCVLVR